MNAPLVSVILPTFNRVTHLRESVASVLAQTCRDWELIIADDGSDDITRSFLASLTDPRVRVLWLPHSGNPAASRNAALRVACGRYLAFLDSDDLWETNKLEIQAAHLDANPARRWSYSRVRRIDERGAPASEAGVRPWRRIEGPMFEALLNLDALVATPSVMAERTLVEETRGFDEQQRFAEDYDLWLRLALRSEAAALDAPLACVRVHGDNYSRDRVGAHAGWVRLYSKMSSLAPSPRLRRLCRRHQALSGLALSAGLRRAGHPGAAARAFAASALHGWSHAPWWRRVVGARLLPT